MTMNIVKSNIQMAPKIAWKKNVTLIKLTTLIVNDSKHHVLILGIGNDDELLNWIIYNHSNGKLLWFGRHQQNIVCKYVA